MSNSIKDFHLESYTFEGIAKLLHSKNRYKTLPLDAVDEIVDLARRQEIPEGKNRLDVLLAYFEHAITCKVIKKFDLTNKQKQLLFFSIQFLDLFLDDANKRYKDVEKLHDVLTRIATRFHLEIEEQLSFAHKQFAKITNEEDVLCNHLILSTITATFFAKDSNIDRKLRDKILKLSTKIHDDVAKTEEDTDMYTNAVQVCQDFFAKIEKKQPSFLDLKEKEINKFTDNLMKEGELPFNFSEVIAKETGVEVDFVNIVLSKRDDFE